MRLSPAPVRSRTRGARTTTGPRPVMIARSGRWPWRTSRWRPSSVCLSAWPLRKAVTSASTACANRARAPSRRTSVSGSENSAGWISLTTLSWVTACHSFGGEVEARTPPRYAASTPHAVTNFRAYLVPIALGLVAPFSGSLAERWPRLVMLSGMGLCLAAVIGLGQVLTGTPESQPAMMTALALYGAGLGLFIAPNNSATLGAAPTEHAGQAGGLLNLMRAFGTAAGVAVASTLLAWRLVGR